jgi:phosphopentomutase
MMAGKRKFVHFAEMTPGVERYAYGPSASEVLRHALDYVKEAQPDFILAHLAEVDLAGHDAGWGSALQRERISEVDSLLGAFVAELRELTDRPLNLIVTADHGGSGTTHGTSSDADVRIPWIIWGDALEPIRLDGAVGIADAAPTVLSLLGVEIPSGWTGVARARPLRSRL